MTHRLWQVHGDIRAEDVPKPTSYPGFTVTPHSLDRYTITILTTEVKVSCKANGVHVSGPNWTTLLVSSVNPSSVNEALLKIVDSLYFKRTSVAPTLITSPSTRHRIAWLTYFIYIRFKKEQANAGTTVVEASSE